MLNMYMLFVDLWIFKLCTLCNCVCMCVLYVYVCMQVCFSLAECIYVFMFVLFIIYSECISESLFPHTSIIPPMMLEDCVECNSPGGKACR